MLDRRSFLVGLFGAAAVAAAGPIPQALLEAPEEKFVAMVKAIPSFASGGGVEIWCNGKDYSFSPLPGFRPMREESNRLAAQALKELYAAFGGSNASTSN